MGKIHYGSGLITGLLRRVSRVRFDSSCRLADLADFLASIVAVGIIGERMWALRLSMITPRDLLPKVVQEYRKNGVSEDMLARLQKHSPLGQIFAAGLK